MDILIADDNNTDRLILKRILEKLGHTIFAANDGLEAVRLFKTKYPKLIFMDALMPHMDGYEACIEIKALSKQKFIPVIFLTSLQEVNSVARCLEVGGDDVLTKPFNEKLLEAKLIAFKRMITVYDQVFIKNNELQFYSDRLMREHEVAKKVFDNIAHSGNLDHPNIKYSLSPMSVFNGDLLLCAAKPSGGSHLMLADFTGHGLPAAIGAMPVAEIFYGMTIKGFDLKEIVTQINSRLNEILPVGIFCCANFCDINYREKSVRVWSGGLPDAYLVRPGKGLVTSIQSIHLPLGVLEPRAFSAETKLFRYEAGDKLYIYSDGILEATNELGEMFGEQRVLDLICDATETGEIFEPLLANLNEFSETGTQSDDVTLIEYTLNPQQANEDETYEQDSHHHTWPLDWFFSYELRAQSLRNFDPLPMVLQILMECPGLRPYRGTVFTIVSELFSNALDHGILNLDSSLKTSTVGFSEYYELRKQRLEVLKEGSITINMEHQPTKEGGQLIMSFKDTGNGFDVTNIMNSNNNYSGRGLALIAKLCDSVEHSENGKNIKVCYSWDLRR
jgi:two-component system, HptB-dependent secretion and biofilm response regulator